MLNELSDEDTASCSDDASLADEVGSRREQDVVGYVQNEMVVFLHGLSTRSDLHDKWERSRCACSDRIYSVGFRRLSARKFGYNYAVETVECTLNQSSMLFWKRRRTDRKRRNRGSSNEAIKVIRDGNRLADFDTKDGGVESALLGNRCPVFKAISIDVNLLRRHSQQDVCP